LTRLPKDSSTVKTRFLKLYSLDRHLVGQFQQTSYRTAVLTHTGVHLSAPIVKYCSVVTWITQPKINKNKLIEIAPTPCKKDFSPA
jgi:hypothetical protein